MNVLLKHDDPVMDQNMFDSLVHEISIELDALVVPSAEDRRIINEFTEFLTHMEM